MPQLGKLTFVMALVSVFAIKAFPAFYVMSELVFSPENRYVCPLKEATRINFSFIYHQSSAFRGFNLYKYMYMLGIVCHGKGSTCRKRIRLICEVYACASHRLNVAYISYAGINLLNQYDKTITAITKYIVFVYEKKNHALFNIVYILTV